MEFVVKVTVTLVIVVLAYYQFCILKWTWTNQIDPKATISRILKKAQPDTDFIAIRDPNKIYQAGNSVGDVTGNVIIQGDLTVFEELSNTKGLNRGIPFQYRRDKYKIDKIGTSIGMNLNMGASGLAERKENVLKNVVCSKFN